MQFTDQVTAVLIAICASIPVAILGCLCGRAYRDGQRVRTIVYALTFIHETALIAIPGWYSCLTGFQLEAGIGVTPDQLLRVYSGEALFGTLFGLVLLLAKRNPKVMRQSTPERQQILSERLLLYGLAGGAALLYVGRLFSPVFTPQDVAQHYQIVVKASIWDSAVDWAMTLVQWPGLVAAAMLAANKSLSRPIRLMGASALVGELIFAMLHGFRGGVVWVVSMIAIGGFYQNRKRVLVGTGVMTLLLIPLFPWLHSTMRYASLGAPIGTSRVDMIPFLIGGITDFNTIAQASNGASFLDSWAIRAEGPRNSITLYALHDRGEAASYRPILGSVVLPVPRMWWPDKPVAGSTDSTSLGSAMYRVQQTKPNSVFYDMGPSLASAHAYWEGGWLWLIAASLSSAWMWRWLLAWGERAERTSVDVIILTFLTALPIDGFFGAINPVFAYVRILWITIIPLGILLIALNSLVKSRTRAKGVRNLCPNLSSA